jgi:hypothetical protein
MKKYTMTQIKPVDVISGVETLKDTATSKNGWILRGRKTSFHRDLYKWAQDGYDFQKHLNFTRPSIIIMHV